MTLSLKSVDNFCEIQKTIITFINEDVVPLSYKEIQQKITKIFIYHVLS